LVLRLININWPLNVLISCSMLDIKPNSYLTATCLASGIRWEGMELDGVLGTNSILFSVYQRIIRREIRISRFQLMGGAVATKDKSSFVIPGVESQGNENGSIKVGAQQL